MKFLFFDMLCKQLFAGVTPFGVTETNGNDVMSVHCATIAALAERYPRQAAPANGDSPIQQNTIGNHGVTETNGNDVMSVHCATIAALAECRRQQAAAANGDSPIQQNAIGNQSVQIPLVSASTKRASAAKTPGSSKKTKKAVSTKKAW